jgi:hypothetical protein
MTELASFLLRSSCSTLLTTAFHSATHMGPFNMFSHFFRCSSSVTRKRLFPFPQLHLSSSATTRPIVYYQNYPPWSSSPTMILSPQSAIRADLVQLPEIEKWGWVIYRCTYADDTTWAKFRDLVETESRESIAQSDAPDIAERMEWKWVEDASELDGASTAALREWFRLWAAGEVARQPGDYDPAVVPRFRYFIKIDQEVMHSLAESIARGTLFSNDAFVKFVDGNWEPSVESQQVEEQEDYGWAQEIWEPIDGCTEEDVGWMRVAPHMINTDFYDVLSGDENLWITFYRRPPRIVCY